ncbi:MAG TPA: isopentenyl-diphosphate Delta-isomerase [Woeseiaceae bacterium]
MKDNLSRIVSSEAEELILVDADDTVSGSLDKASCHDGRGILHRAFSLFIFDQRGRLLLQQRSADKRLWPLYWSNSCCSHPRVGESMEKATARRLQDELNIRAQLEFVYKFTYQASYETLGSEHELCWVYLGRVEQPVLANRHEIAATRFLGVAELRKEMATVPEHFTPWFKLEWQRLENDHASVLGKYLTPL